MKGKINNTMTVNINKLLSDSKQTQPYHYHSMWSSYSHISSS